MEAFYVEMMLFLHVNLDKIPVVIPPLSKMGVQSCLPRRFTGRDPELLQVHDFIDPLGNPSAPIDLADDPDHIEGV